MEKSPLLSDTNCQHPQVLWTLMRSGRISLPVSIARPFRLSWRVLTLNGLRRTMLDGLSTKTMRLFSISHEYVHLQPNLVTNSKLLSCMTKQWLVGCSQAVSGRWVGTKFKSHFYLKSPCTFKRHFLSCLIFKISRFFLIFNSILGGKWHCNSFSRPNKKFFQIITFISAENMSRNPYYRW